MATDEHTALMLPWEFLPRFGVVQRLGRGEDTPP